MARVDKTDSAVGVVRAVLNADIVLDDFEDGLLAVGLNSTGKVVPGAGQTGIIGVLNPSRFFSKAGTPVDIFVLADIEDIGEGANDPTLDAGKPVYADNTTGVLSHTSAGGTYIGFTVEADRLILAIGGGSGLASAGIAAVTLTAVPGSFADEAAVQSYLSTLVTQLKSSAVFD